MGIQPTGASIDRSVGNETSGVGTNLQQTLMEAAWGGAEGRTRRHALTSN